MNHCMIIHPSKVFLRWLISMLISFAYMKIGSGEWNDKHINFMQLSQHHICDVTLLWWRCLWRGYIEWSSNATNQEIVLGKHLFLLFYTTLIILVLFVLYFKRNSMKNRFWRVRGWGVTEMVLGHHRQSNLNSWLWFYSSFWYWGTFLVFVK